MSKSGACWLLALFSISLFINAIIISNNTKSQTTQPTTDVVTSQSSPNATSDVSSDSIGSSTYHLTKKYCSSVFSGDPDYNDCITAGTYCLSIRNTPFAPHYNDCVNFKWF